MSVQARELLDDVCRRLYVEFRRRRGRQPNDVNELLTLVDELPEETWLQITQEGDEDAQ